MANSPRAKRVPPATVPSLTIGDLRIDVIHWGRDEGFGQNGGVLRAVDTTSGATAWVVKVYDISYDPHLESDVQDIFITALRKPWLRNCLVVSDERGRQFRVDLATRAVAPE
jgi:hypothetical protein